MRIALAEDSTLLRAGLVELLRVEGHQVTAAEGRADALLVLVETDPPDLVILDVRMPPTFTDEGVRAALDLRRRHPRLPLVILSQHVETRHAAQLLGDDPAGVGYLLKDSVLRVADFLDALDRVRAGSVVLDPAVVRRLMTRPHDPLAALSPRETEVLGLMAEGHTNLAIGARLHLSRSAVEKHVQSIFGKLDLPEHPGTNRRVLAILRFLDPSRPPR